MTKISDIDQFKSDKLGLADNIVKLSDSLEQVKGHVGASLLEWMGYEGKNS
jgi:hypothetical protein